MRDPRYCVIPKGKAKNKIQINRGSNMLEISTIAKLIKIKY